MGQIGEVVQGTEAALQSASTSLKAAQASQAALAAQADRFDRRAAATTLLGELEAKKETVEAYRQKLALAERAERLRSSLGAEQGARQSLALVEQGLQEQLRAARQARDVAQALPPSVLGLDLVALPNSEALASAGADLAARGPRCGSWRRRPRRPPRPGGRVRRQPAGR